MGTDSFDPLAFDILLGLREGMRFRRTVDAIAGKDRVAKEDAEQKVADAIAAKLRHSNWLFRRGQAISGGAGPDHGTDPALAEGWRKLGDDAA